MVVPVGPLALPAMFVSCRGEQEAVPGHRPGVHGEECAEGQRLPGGVRREPRQGACGEVCGPHGRGEETWCVVGEGRPLLG